MRARVSIDGTVFDITVPVRRATPRGPEDRVPHAVLVVDVDREALSSMSAVLADGGDLLSRASSFSEAPPQLVLARPDPPITAIRPRGVNGLPLVLRHPPTFPDLCRSRAHPGP